MPRGVQEIQSISSFPEAESLLVFIVCFFTCREPAVDVP